MTDILQKFDSDHEARRIILEQVLHECMDETSEFLKADYPDSKTFEDARIFCSDQLMDAPSADIRKLNVMGFFPWTEATLEMDHCLSLAFCGFYKHAYDSLRRALELVTVGSFFLSSSERHAKGHDWFHSKHKTPQFTKAIDALLKIPDFVDLNGHRSDPSWEESIKTHYWELCDVVHVRGVEKSYNEISRLRGSRHGVSFLGFSDKAFRKIIDGYIATTRHLAMLVATSNPILLMGVDLDEKFGTGGPASGFYYPCQADRLLRLIPAEYQDYFQNVLATDDRIHSVKSWLEGLPNTPLHDWI